MRRAGNCIRWKPGACGILLAHALLLTGCVHYEAKPLSAAKEANAIDGRRLDDPALKDFVRMAAANSVTNWPPSSWNFETLTLVALYYNPNLEVARAQWGTATAGIKTAGARPNPILSVTPGYSANSPVGTSPWFPLGTLDVPIETAHKRRFRMNHAADLTEAARLNVYSAAWQVRSALRTALIERNYAQARFDLIEKQAQAQRELVTLLEQRLAAGTIATPEIAPARVILLKALADLAVARSQLATSGSGLAQALGVPLKALEGVVIDYKAVLAGDHFEKYSNAEARDNALQKRPDVLASLAEYAAAEAALQLEIAKQYPDVHLSPGYQFDQGEHKWSLGLSIELPVLNRNQGPIAEADAKRVEIAARFLATQAKVISEVDRALQGYAAAEDQLRSSEALLATQQKQAAAVEAALQAGGADQYELLSARLEASVALLSVVESQYKLQQTFGQLEDAFQFPFESLRNVDIKPLDKGHSEHL
ncbi:MAG: Outer rane efflux protein [Verrucomicrobiales bacterium]|nr:Outer rane efflux protein [Verrucomicrobiales bacterium]